MTYKWLLLFTFTKVIVSGFQITNIFQNISSYNLTYECANSLELYNQNLYESPADDQWALRMLDATSKIPVGLLFSYNFGELGNFKQCVETVSKDKLIHGKYCLGSLSITTDMNNSPNISVQRRELVKEVYLRSITWTLSNTLTSSRISNPTWSLCLPNNCTSDDVFKITDSNNSMGLKFISFTCQTEEDLNVVLSSGSIAALALLSLIICMMILSTVYDLYCNSNNMEPVHSLLIAFSVYSNGKKLLSVNKNSSEISCLNGIKFLSIIWVVSGHTFSVFTAGPLANVKDAVDWSNTLGSMIMVNGSLAVDTFLVVGGVLVVYVTSKARHQGIKFNIFQYYFHRYLRLTPALAAVVLVSATLIEYMGSGPYWNYIKTAFAGNCKDYWWTALLYVQNYVNVSTMCVGQTWYLCIDMQLYLISPIILFLLWKHNRIGIFLLVLSILIFIAIPFYIAFEEELAGIISNLYPKTSSNIFMNHYYLKTHGRAAPWLIGIVLGYLISAEKFGNFKIPRINKGIIFLIWIIWASVLLACLLGGHSTLRNSEYDRLGNSFYIAFIRPIWALCISWIIWACEMGYGGPINTFLSLPLYQILNRFTYSIYLLHVTMLYMIVFSAKTSTYFTVFNMAYLFWGIYMFSFILSIIWVLAFESPIIIIEKSIFQKKQ